ncbi:MAG TPA: hypothetical protein VNH19_17730 [Candidatus Limnocylindrales bacterium]|nr:hypothetical protein [Candidatus Limnocylindrales bacterium]
MNVHLTYQSGQSYSDYFEKFSVTVSGGGMKRVKISIREQKNGRGYASFSLPVEKAQQLAHAILAASAGIEQPIEFTVEESKTKTVAA